MWTMSTPTGKMRHMARPARAATKPNRPYHHGNLRRALLDEAVATIRAEGVTGLTLREVGGRGRAGFDTMGVAYVRFAVANPSHYRVMFGGFVDPEQACEPELATEAAGAFQALVDALATLQRDGSVRGDDAALMARFVWAVVHGVAMLGIDGQL